MIKINNSYLLGCLLMMLSACREEIIHLSNETEANQVLLVLREGSIEATKKLSAKEWVIEVPKSDLTRALRIMTDSKIPKKLKQKNTEEANQSIFSSKQDKDSARDRELATELSTILGEIPGIIEAKVSIFNAALDPLSLSSKPERSASIMIISGNKLELDKNSIIDLVAKGAGVSNNKISFISSALANSKITEKSEEITLEKAADENTSPVIAKTESVPEVSDNTKISTPIALNSENKRLKILNFLSSQKYILSIVFAFITILALFIKKKNSSHAKLNKILAEVSILEGKGA